MWTEGTFWKLLICTETKPIEEVSKAEDQKDELSVTDTPRYVIFSSTLILSLIHKKSDKSLFTISIGETSRNYLIILLVYYLIMWLMKSPKNFEKIAILKIWQLVSFWGGKTHFGKTPLK